MPVSLDWAGVPRWLALMQRWSDREADGRHGQQSRRPGGNEVSGQLWSHIWPQNARRLWDGRSGQAGNAAGGQNVNRREAVRFGPFDLPPRRALSRPCPSDMRRRPGQLRPGDQLSVQPAGDPASRPSGGDNNLGLGSWKSLERPPIARVRPFGLRAKQDRLQGRAVDANRARSACRSVSDMLAARWRLALESEA